MKCPYSHKHFYNDPFSGELRCIDIPCGKCAICIKALQDQFLVRLLETGKSYGSFIYDTLTIADEHADFVDVSDLVCRENWDDYLSEDSYNMLVNHYQDCLVPTLDKKHFSTWIKRGRELYFYDNGERMKIKYLACLEYGPKTSRPHIHLMLFGLSRSDYNYYFRDRWRREHGFTKTKYINLKSKGSYKDLSCITSYVSKYITKGEFESPFVFDKIQPKPWRQLSHGIGEEYLKRHADFFLFLKSPDAIRLLKHEAETWFVRYDTLTSKYVPYKRHVPSERYTDFDLNVSESNLTHLTTYFDDSGYPHKLPRYYFDKLLPPTSNQLRYEIQNILLAHYEQHRYKEISEFATAAGCTGLDKFCSSSELLEYLRSAYPLVYASYLLDERRKALDVCKGNKTKLKNFYNRPLCDTFNTL